MGTIRNRSVITRMEQQQQQQQQNDEIDDSDDSSSACYGRGSNSFTSSIDDVAAASASAAAAATCRPSSSSSSTPLLLHTKKEQPLFSSLRDVAIHQQVTDADAAAEHQQGGGCIVLQQMLQSWIFGIILPMSVVTWNVTGHCWSATISAAFFMPTFAIVQGAIGILTYRLYYGDAPMPLSPSHGVVVCTAAGPTAANTTDVSGSKINSTIHTTIQQQQQQQQQHTRVSSGGCECCGMVVPSNSCCSSVLSKGSRLFLQRQQAQAVLYQQQQQSHQQPPSLQQQQQELPPLRLLVIGDSLALGVGQKNSCTPVMPETIAKTLSQKMGGRVVYWTCHGQTGASAAMLVRELERGQSAAATAAAAAAAAADLDTSTRSTLSIDADENNLEPTTNTRASLPLSRIPKTAVSAAAAAPPPRSSSLSCCSDTDDSSTEDECSSEFNTTTTTTVPVRARTCSDNTSNRSTAGRIIFRRARTTTTATAALQRGGGGEEQDCSHHFKTAVATKNTKTTATTSEEEMAAAAAAASSSSSMAIWRDLLHQHRKLFEHPEYLGPYDIAVVLTGPNDLKGAVFPFLLHGEDKEFQRQAKERGGSYRLELRRLLVTLNRKMQWGNFQQFVSAAKESMREKMEEAMERIIITTTSSSSSTTTAKEATTMAPSAAVPPQTNDQRIDEDEQQQQNSTGNKEHVPLIVLPGMPARALPLFQHVPLRWLAVPGTDMMDMHKRHLAKSHPDEVLFVNAPTERELGLYVDQMAAEMGVDDSSAGISSCNNDETVLLALRDVKRRDCRRTKVAMRSYYAKKALLQKSITCSAYMNNPFKLIRTHLLGFPPASHLKAFSPDGVHPNDTGYEFWGRHIGNAIYDKYMAKEETNGHDRNL